MLGTPSDYWQLEHLTSQGVDRVLLIVGYRGDTLRGHVGDGSRFRLRVTWIDKGAIFAAPAARFGSAMSASWARWPASRWRNVL
jgi:NDP-sugar pyrophosphorylase family protein